jgi:hypothetical protein
VVQLVRSVGAMTRTLLYRLSGGVFFFESGFIKRSMLTTNKDALGFVDYVCLKCEYEEGRAGGKVWVG